MYEYAIELAPDDNGTLLATCPAVPELTSFGRDEAEALRQARRALVAAMAFRVEEGMDIPKPGPTKGRPVVALPTQAALKLALYEAMRRQGVNKSELGRRLGMDEKHIRRMLDLTHRSRQEQIDDALEALGLETRVTVVERHAA